MAIANRLELTELKALPERIDATERRLAELDERLADPALYTGPDDERTRITNEREGATTETGREGLRNTHSESRRDGGIDRVAPLLEYPCTRLRSSQVGRNDHARATQNRRPRCRTSSWDRGDRTEDRKNEGGHSEKRHRPKIERAPGASSQEPRPSPC